MNNILLTSGFNESRFALCVLERLRCEGIKVNKCIIGKKSFRKSVTKLKTLSVAGALKIIQKKISRDKKGKYQTPEQILINSFMKQNNITGSNLDNYCISNEIEYLIAENINDGEALDFAEGTDLIIYAGGGIIKKGLLEKPTIGILNCHNGYLPAIRGMNATEWSVFLGIRTVNTLHFIESGIDTGPILCRIEHDYNSSQNIKEIRAQSVINSIDDLVKGVKMIHKGEYTLENQCPADGKQYFRMHTVLKNYLNKKISRR